jgi:hypothetical protein
MTHLPNLVKGPDAALHHPQRYIKIDSNVLCLLVKVVALVDDPLLEITGVVSTLRDIWPLSRHEKMVVV